MQLAAEDKTSKEVATALGDGSRIQIEITDDESIFRAAGVVAYVTSEVMGIAFGLVEAGNYEVLEEWLSGTPSI